jgi:hypothetical protein
MGSLFGAPKAPPPPPLPKLETPDPDADARQARLDALKRRRRGRAGTIVTGRRGVLRPSNKQRAGKRLLGE